MGKKSKRIQNVYRLSPMQEGMLFHSLLEKGSTAYVEQNVFSIKGEIDCVLFEKSFNVLIRRYDIFRTVFFHENLDEPLQIVLKERKYEMPVEDITHRTEDQKQEYLEAFKEKDRGRGFDLSKDLLMRVCLFKTGIESYKLVWTFHHIIMDGWCLGIVFKDWVWIYEGLKKGESPRLEPVVQYENYIHWLEQQEKSEGLNYWKIYLDGYERPATLPKWGKPLKPSGSDNYRLEKHGFILDETMSKGLMEIARKHRVTVNVLFQVIWGVLLQRYNNTNDVVFGTVLSGRPAGIEGIENMVGLFINTVPVRVKVKTKTGINNSFLQLIKIRHQEALLSKAHEYIPLAEIQANSLLKGHLIDHIIAFENYPARDMIENIGIEQTLGFSIEGMESFEQTHYHFNIIVAPGKTIQVEFSFNSLIYRLDFIRRAALHFKEIIRQVTENSGLDVDIGTIEILTEEEKQQILYDFNDTCREYPREKAIPALFADQAQRTPDRVALIGQIANCKLQISNKGVPCGRVLKAFSEDSLRAKNHELRAVTYKELNEKSNQLAALLIEKGVLPDTIVGIMLERSIEMIFGILGILKAGDAYLPIDPDYPEKRKQYMLKDSSAKILLTLSGLSEKYEKLSIVNCQLLMVNEEPYRRRLNTPPKEANNNLQLKRASLAYILYTSGTTGRPKGVMVEHRNVVRLVKNTDYIEFKPGNRILQTGAVEFDASTFEIWGSLLNGLSLYLLRKENILSAETLKAAVTQFNITTLWMTAPWFNQVSTSDIEVFMGLKNLLVGGDVLSPYHINQVREKYPGLNIINGYGPTENTTFSTTFRIDKGYNEQGETIPIGGPIANSTAYIVDQYNHLQPVTVTGQLWVGGDGVARGYLNNPELTAEKFLFGSFSFYRSYRSYKSYNLYETGDLARWLPDGNIEFLGRIDQQVKIRGFRIEPGEIATQLLKHDEIKEAVVIARDEENGDKYLCAYIVLNRGKRLEKIVSTSLAAELKKYLSRSLPQYMIPAYFTRLEKIPLTPNGKVDRKALPGPGIQLQEEYTYITPRDELEKKLVMIWEEVLGPGIERASIGIDDNFFHLGGHSLKATILVSHIRKEFNVEFPLAEVFEGPTVRAFAGYIKTAKPGIYEGIVPIEKRAYYPQSSAQKRLFFLDRFEHIGTSYNMPSVLRLEGKLNKCRFERTIHGLIERHNSLRTSFHMSDHEPIQRVHEEVEFEVEYYQVEVKVEEEEVPFGQVLNAFGDQSPKTRELRAKSYIKNFIRPFDLAEAPLLRVGLIHTPRPLLRRGHPSQEGNFEDKYFLILDMHHIISDGMSMQILVDEFAWIYEEEEPPPLKIQYKDFSCWQNNRFAAGKVKEQEGYWLNLYADVEDIPVLNLPVDYPRPAVFSFAGDRYRFYCDTSRTLRMKQFCTSSDTTIFMHLLTALNVLLHKYTGQDDIIVGCGISGRRYADIDHIIGLFVNTLALRNHPVPDKTFMEFLKEVKHACINAFENQDLQLEELVRLLKLKREASRHPLFDVCLVNQNFEQSKKEIKGIIVEPYQQFENKTSKLDLTLFVHEGDGEIYFELEYYTAIFKRETIERLAGHFLNLLERLTEEPQIRISDIDLLAAEERNRLLYVFNDTTVPYPGDKILYELFAEQAERTPDYVALIGVGTRFIASDSWKQTIHVTYRELNQKANQLACLLRKKGVKAGAIVGIMVEQPLEIAVGILGILKVGGAYLPIDPAYPEERIDYMLADSNAKILLTSREIAEFFSPQASLNLSEGRPFNSHHSCYLAYIIYTSGTTGKPKGVMIEQKSAVNTLFYRKEEYQMDANVTALHFFSYTFDAFVTSFFTPVISGGRVILLSKEEVKDIAKIKEEIVKNHVTHLTCVPAVYQAIIESLTKEEIELSSLKVVTLGGDQWSSDLLEITQSKNQTIEIAHEYGVTEAAVMSTIYRHQERDNRIKIGHPIGNTKLYIVDKGLKLQPIGIPGELCIAGVGAARGYLNNPELTFERFINYKLQNTNHKKITSYKSQITNKKETTSPHYPISPLPQSPIYRTGDLARWLTDGNIEFIGRIDHQVKVRGFRVELGEIENCLKKMELVKETVVVDRKDKTGETYLCAYVVLLGGREKESDILQLKSYLSARLPYFMIPGYFMVLENIPLTPNGKVDRKALPEPQTSVLSATYEPPTDEVENQMAGIWQQVLGVDRISINDNFFEIGGDSIKALQVSARLLQVDLKLEISDLYANPTIKQARKKTKICGIHPRSPQGTITGEVVLTPIQEWFFQTPLTRKHHFNQSVMLYRRDGFDEEIIDKVFTRLVEHHDALRMVYPVNAGQVVQRNRGWEQPLFHLRVKDLRACEPENIAGEIEKEANRIQRVIDLNKGPLVHLGLFKTTRGDHLLMVIHHLVVDGVSWRILLEDFALGYSQAERSDAIGLPKKTDSFKYWARKLNDYSKSKEARKELSYWKRVEEAKTNTGPLSKDREATKAEKKNKNVETITVSIDEAETGKLLKEGNKAYNTTINDILLTALGLALKKWTGLEKAAINLEGHGREPIIPGIHIGRTVGWFTTQYPVVLDMNQSEELSYNIKFVKETLKKIPNKGIGYGILRYLTPTEQKQGFVIGPEPEINFNYLGEFTREVGGNGSGSTIEISRFDTGESLDPEAEPFHSIDIGGMLVEGNLQMRFSYNKYEYKRETMQTLAGFFKLHLETIIALCSQKEKREFTPSDLGYNKISLEELQKIEKLVDEEIRQIYPLAPMQTGMLFHAMKNKTSRAYFEQIILNINGNLDIPLFEKSFKKLVEKYDILRTVFVYQHLEEPLQVILKKRDARIHYEDISLMEENKKEHFLETFKRKDREKGFDLTRDLLIKISIFKTAEKSFQLVWDFHHILMDGWCSRIIYNDLIRVYQHFKKGELLPMAPVPPYKNYIQWLEKQDKEEGLKYWRKYLDGYEQPAIIPRPGKPLEPLGNDGYQVKEYCFVLDEKLSRELREIARKHRVTVNLLFQAVWGVLLQRYNNTLDVIFGSVVSGRPPEVEGIENMVGLFINTIPVRITVQTKGKTFYQLVETLYKQALLSKPHEYIPLAEIQANSWLKGLLIDHIMVFENYPFQELVKYKEFEESLGFSIEMEESFEQTNYDFNIIVRPGETIHVIFNFNSLVYPVDFIENTALHVKKIFRQVTKKPELDIDIGEIDIVTEEEKHRLIDEFNDTEMDFPGDKTIQRLFAEQAERTPDHTALVGSKEGGWKGRRVEGEKEKTPFGGCGAPALLESFGGMYLTYRELNKTSGQLAQALKEKGVKFDTIVGLMVGRSVEMVIGILGILKSDSAYMPIDAEYPEERINYMLEDSNVKVLLTTPGLFGKLEKLSIVNCQLLMVNEKPSGCRRLNIPPKETNIINNYQLTINNLQFNSASLAYVIYTSGSTGRPKGVMLEHRSLVNLLIYHYRHTNLDFFRVAQFASICFDVSFQEIFFTLLAGGTLYILDKQTKTDISAFCGVIRKNKIQTLFLPISFIKMIFREADYASQFPGSIRHIVSAGEQVVVLDWFRKYLKESNVYLHNHYGPSETHVVTALTLDPDNEIPELPSIGRPISNTAIYILDKSMHLQPVGITGELAVGGAAVGRGYLNNPELTAEKFCLRRPGALFEKTAPGPRKNFLLLKGTGNHASRQSCSHAVMLKHYHSPQAPIYLTGDLACWLPDGNIEFLGRIDHQVKIRGFRIETGEIESQLLKDKKIKEARVIDNVDSSGDKYLCAYIVSDSTAVYSELKEYLSRSLPGYMVPSYFVRLEKMPLTPSGKLDRKALPKTLAANHLKEEYMSARNEIEEKLVEIWIEVLGKDSSSSSQAGQRSIGIDDNFFDRGGHSLKAAVLAAKIHKAFNTRVPLAQIFKTPFIREISRFIASAKKTIYKAIPPAEKRDYYPQSSAQKRLFFLDQFENIGTSYNMPFVVKIEGTIDIERFQKVFLRLVQQHESLRTSFHLIDNEPIQRIHEATEFEIEFYDLYRTQVEVKDKVKESEGTRGLAPLPLEPANSRSQLATSTIKNFIRPFDPEKVPLLRTGLIKEDNTRHILMIDMHHIISDGTSLEILADEFVRLYAGETPVPLKIQYKDFSIWQNHLVETGKMKEQESYWLELYTDVHHLPVLNLPVDYPRPLLFTFEGDRYQFQLGTAGTQRMKQLSTDNHTTIFMNLLTAFNVLLNKYTRQEDMIVGIGIAGRRHADLHHLIGLFVNMLALRTYPAPGKTYREFLKEVKQASIKTFENQDMQFEELVDKLELKRDTSRNPLFDVCLVNQNFELSKKKMNEVIFEPYETLENKTSKFDLTLFVYESKDNIYFNLEYYTRIFKRVTMVRLANHFLNLLEQVLAEPGTLISDIDIMSAEEKNRLLYDFNDTAVRYPIEKTIHELFAEQAERIPDKIALVGTKLQNTNYKQNCKTSITYKELNQKSNQLAHLLKQKGVGADTIVGIMMERSLEMIVGIIGILKSGSAYMPIDPDYPEERIDFMLKDSNTKILLSNMSGVSKVSEVIELSPDSWKSPLERGTPKGGGVSKPAARLAYIIYTSGSTGKPKGTLTNHYNVIPVVKNTNYIEIKEDDRILQLSNYAFDGSIFDIHGALLNGAALVLIKKEKIIAVDQLAHLVKREGITVFFITTALFNALVDLQLGCLVNIRKVLFGGERVSSHHCKRALEFLGKNRIIHVYGPTETTVYATFYMINHIDEGIGTIPIGSPLSNTVVYILDKGLKPVPLGVNGEIYIGGNGVARGYLNNPEMTNSKFQIPNPKQIPNFKSQIPNKKETTSPHYPITPLPQSPIYRTGDLARWLPEGNIEFTGRIDQQVKLRGFRVEPGEIENRLLEHENIKKVVVTVGERGTPGKISEKYLCAYIVGTGATGGTPDTRELRNFLSCTLPDYMIPSYFISLEKIPLTPNGKVDRKALPEPGAHKFEAGEKYIAPRNEVEEKLAEIWSEVLFGSNALHESQSPRGIDDDFFELGGHSLKATVFLARVHKELNVKIPLPEIFIKPTIRGLGEFIRGKVLDKFAPIPPTEEKEYYSLSSAQKRIYILQQSDQESTAYNMPQNVVIKGDVGKKMLEETFMKLIQRHESFRTSFHIVGEEPVQKVHSHVTFEIEYFVNQGDIEGTRGLAPLSKEPATRNWQPEKALISSFIRPFDLSCAPLMRVGLIHTPQPLRGHPRRGTYNSQQGNFEDNYILMLDMHHIVSDGASTAIFIREFMAFYEGKELLGLRIQYKDFAEWQNHPATSGKIKKQEEYWLRRFEGEIPMLNLPLDSARTTAYHSQGTAVLFEIGNQLTGKVKQLMGETGTTAYMLLLAVYNILLSKYSGQEDIIVGSGIAGRRHADLQNVIGMFVNMLAMRNRPLENKTFLQFLQEVKGNALKAYENQDYQFDRLVEKLGVEREFGRNPIFDTQFTFQNLVEQGKEGPSNEIPNLKIEPYESGNENKKMQFDLSLNGIETGENIVMTLQYVSALFKESTIREMTRHYIEILDQVVEDTNIKLKDINVSHDLLAGKSMLKEEDSLDYDF